MERITAFLLILCVTYGQIHGSILKVKRSEGTGSSAGAVNNCLFFCPPDNGNVQTGNGTGTSGGGKNGTQAGTGSSANGGTTVPPNTGGSRTTASSGGGNSGNGNGNGNGTQAGTGSSINGGSTMAPNTGGSGTTTGSSGGGTGTNTGGTGTNTGTGTGSSVNSGTTVGPGASFHGVTNAVDLPNINTPDNLNQTSECRDLLNCRVYPKEKICTKDSIYRPWAEARCKVYCSFCDPHTSPKPCVDNLPNCNEYDADLCTNPIYRLFREDNCSKFCGLCTDNGASTVSGP